MSEAPETGVCDYVPIYTVTTYTSGNELRGPAVHFGKFDSDRSARQALTDAGFTNGQFGWRKGYTDATIVKSTEYTNHRAIQPPADLVEVKAKILMDVLKGIIEEYYEPDNGRSLRWEIGAAQATLAEMEKENDNN